MLGPNARGKLGWYFAGMVMSPGAEGGWSLVVCPFSSLGYWQGGSLKGCVVDIGVWIWLWLRSGEGGWMDGKERGNGMDSGL